MYTARLWMFVLVAIQGCWKVHSHFMAPLFPDVKFVLADRTRTPVGSLACMYFIDDKSKSELKNLELKKKRNLVYLNINFDHEMLLPEENYDNILQINKWIWVSPTQGMKLLQLDFRFEFLSLGTLSYDVGYVNINMTMKCPGNNTQRTNRDHVITILQTTLRDAVNIDSFLCYEALTNSSNTYYIQKHCCSFDEMKGCGEMIEQFDSGWIQIAIYAVIFALSPLLLASVIPHGSGDYAVEDTGQLKRKKSLAHRMMGKKNNPDKEFDTIEEVDFPNYAAKLDTRVMLNGTAGTEENMTITKIDLLSHHPTVSTDPLYSAPSTSEQPIRNENVEKIRYIAFSKETPVRITHPLKFLLLLNVDNVVLGVVRRFLFFAILYPSLIHIYIIVVFLMYDDEVQLLSNVETKMNITGKLSDMWFFDHLYTGNFFTDKFFVIRSMSMVAYAVMAIIFASGAPMAMMMDRLVVDDGYFGFMKLPQWLKQKSTYDQGVKRLRLKMMHRLSLIVDPKFWIFWFQELWSLFRCQHHCCQNGCKGVVLKLLLLFGNFISLLALFPLVNCLPFDMLMKAIRKPEESETKRLIKKYGHRRLLKLLVIIIAVLITLWGVLFALYIFMESSRLFGLILIYTVKGIVKNYLQILPIFSIIMAGIHFLNTTLGKVERQYVFFKKLIFDECQRENEQLQAKYESGKHRPVKSPLVIYRKDGIPLIPENLYNKVLHDLFPLRNYELRALGKLIVTGCFLYIVAMTIGVFHENSVTDLGQALATFLAATLPNMIQSANNSDLIDSDCWRYKVRAEIKNNFTVSEGVTSGGGDGDDEFVAEAADVSFKLLEDSGNLTLPEGVLESDV